MKKIKKVLALLLILAMAMGTLAACGSKEETKDTTKTEGTKTEDTGKTDDTGSTEDGGGEVEVEDEWTWPLEETKELSIWLTWTNDYAEEINDLHAIKVIEENTNVHVNWVALNSTEAAEKFGLMVASGDYPDILRQAEAYYSGGLTALENDGVIIDMTDLIPKYMPTYQALRTSDPELERATKADDGRMIGLYTLASNNGVLQGERIWLGLNIRQDWLDDLGLEVPVTVDDWHTVLTAFKENYGCEAPLMTGQYGYDYCGNFITAFGASYDMMLDGEKVVYGPVQEGYKQWVELFRQWYAEGLIDPNFTANAAIFMAPAEYIGTDRAGAGMNIWDYTTDMWKMYGFTQDEDYWLTPVPAPVLNEGDTPQIVFRTSELTKETVSITTNCKDVELACRYLDYWYTQECMLLDSYGIEGDSYYVDEDGNYRISDKLKEQVANGEYPSLLAAHNMYYLNQSDFGLYNWARFEVINEGSQNIQSQKVWDVADFDLALPANITLTTEEANAIGTIYTDIKTLVNETTIQFILGQKDMSEWDSYVEQVYQYGLEQVVAAYQAAYDRYMAR